MTPLSPHSPVRYEREADIVAVPMRKLLEHGCGQVPGRRLRAHEV